MGLDRKRGARRMTLALACCLSNACTSAAFDPEASPFSQAEIQRSLAPVEQIQRTCYKNSASQLAKRRVRFEYIAYVDERGAVFADPVVMDPHDPSLSQCLKTHLDQLSFPAKGTKDQFNLRLDLKP